MRLFSTSNEVHSLSAHLMAIVFSLYVVLATTITLFQLYVDFSENEKFVNEELAVVAKGFAPAIAQSLWHYNIDEIHLTAKGILDFPGIIGIEIYNEKSVLISALGLVMEEGRSIKQYLPDASSKEIQTYSRFYSYDLSLVASYDGGADIADHLILYSNSNVVFYRVKYILLNTVLSAIIKSIGLWVIFIYVANKRLATPLNQFLTEVEKIKLYNLKTYKIEVETFGGNELSLLRDAFNEMLMELGEAEEEKIKIHEELFSLNETLEERVKKRTSELAASNHELTKSIEALRQTQDQLIETGKMAALGEMVVGIAHEINTPLGVAMTAVSHIKDKSKKMEDEFNDDNVTKGDLRKFLEIINEASNLSYKSLSVSAELIEAFKKVAVTRGDEQKRWLNVKEFINEILSTLKTKLAVTNPYINIVVEDDLQVHSYPSAYYQIISGLVMNSLDHGFEFNEGGEISISITQEQQYIKIEFYDDGKGMAPDEVSRVFNPFFTTKRGTGGTGLGLYIIYNLVTQKLGGTIECESEPNKGTLFKMVFPIEGG